MWSLNSYCHVLGGTTSSAVETGNAVLTGHVGFEPRPIAELVQRGKGKQHRHGKAHRVSHDWVEGISVHHRPTARLVLSHEFDGVLHQRLQRAIFLEWTRRIEARHRPICAQGEQRRALVVRD